MSITDEALSCGDPAGYPSPAVMVTIHLGSAVPVPALTGAIWLRRTVAGIGPGIGGAEVGYAVRVTQPLPTDRPGVRVVPYSRSLGPWLAWPGGSVVS